MDEITKADGAYLAKGTSGSVVSHRAAFSASARGWLWLGFGGLATASPALLPVHTCPEPYPARYPEYPL